MNYSNFVHKLSDKLEILETYEPQIITIQHVISVPASSPESVTIELYNETVAIVTWRPPPKRELQGELKGFKLLIDCDLNVIEVKNGTSKNGPPTSIEAASQLNFTLDSDTHTLTFDISINATYHVQVAAYNRQGIGPFSERKTLKVITYRIFFKIRHVLKIIPLLSLQTNLLRSLPSRLTMSCFQTLKYLYTIQK